MNEVVVIKRNDTSRIPKWLPLIISNLRAGIFLYDFLDGKNGRPSAQSLYDWLNNENNQPLAGMARQWLEEARRQGADAVVDSAAAIAMSEIFDETDAIIKEKQVKMRLAVASRLAPRKYGQRIDALTKDPLEVKNEEIRVPAMTKAQAEALLKKSQP